MSSGKYKFKNWDTHLFESPKCGILTALNAGEDVEQQELSFIAGRMQNGTTTLEDNMVVSYKTKHILTQWSSNHTPWYLPQGVENICPQKKLHMYVYSSFIHNCQNMEATQISFSRWMDRLWYIWTMEYYSVLKKEMHYQSMKRHRGKLNAYYQMKGANLPRLCTVWFQVYNILEKEKLWR